MAPHNVSWTDERIEELKKLWADGLSCSLIARALGNTTRNAVIGKISRLGLSGRRSPTVRSNIPRKPRTQLRRGFSFMQTPKIVAPAPFTARVVELPPLNISLLDLGAKQCRYPVTADSPYFFCGHAQQDGSSYCPAHHAIVWVKPRKLDLSEAERERRSQHARHNLQKMNARVSQ